MLEKSRNRILTALLVSPGEPELVKIKVSSTLMPELVGKLQWVHCWVHHEVEVAQDKSLQCVYLIGCESQLPLSFGILGTGGCHTRSLPKLWYHFQLQARVENRLDNSTQFICEGLKESVSDQVQRPCFDPPPPTSHLGWCEGQGWAEGPGIELWRDGVMGWARGVKSCSSGGGGIVQEFRGDMQEREERVTDPT